MAAKKRAAALLILFSMACAGIAAQSEAQAAPSGRENWPRWLRDMRRWEIVAIGSFPFTMFFSTIGMDLYRWQSANGMDFNDRRYAPWPIKSSGAVPMTNREQRTTIAIAAGMSAGIAVADHFIVRGRRQRAARRAEALPSGTITITRTPLAAEGDEAEDAPDGAALPYEAAPDGAAAGLAPPVAADGAEAAEDAYAGAEEPPGAFPHEGEAPPPPP